MHGFPFKDRSGALRPEERRRESLHAHHGSQRAQSLWRTRDRGIQDHHESHGNATGAGRIEPDRRGKVQSSNRRHAIWGNDAQHADDDRHEGDEQHGNSHQPLPVERRVDHVWCRAESVYGIKTKACFAGLKWRRFLVTSLKP